MESLIETCSLKEKEADKNLLSRVAPELVKVPEKVAAAHWTECQLEVQSLLVAPKMKRKRESIRHGTTGGSDTTLQSVVLYDRGLYIFSVETSFLES